MRVRRAQNSAPEPRPRGLATRGSKKEIADREMALDRFRDVISPAALMLCKMPTLALITSRRRMAAANSRRRRSGVRSATTRGGEPSKNTVIYEKNGCTFLLDTLQ